jgi:hypothetical protein
MDEAPSKQAGAEPATPEDGHGEFSPRGTFLFVLLMLLGYAGYWAFVWITVVLRAGGGA